MSGESKEVEASLSAASGEVLIVEGVAGDVGDRLFLTTTKLLSTDGAEVYVGGVSVGSIDPIDNGEDGQALMIALTGRATEPVIDAVSQALRFEALGDDISSSNMDTTVSVLASDGTTVVAAIEATVPVQHLEHPFVDSFQEQVLAQGLAGATGDQVESPLYVSQDLLSALAGAAAHTVIHGFRPGEGGDMLDLGTLLKQGNYNGGSLAGYVELDDSSGSNTMLRVDVYGNGDYADLAVIEGATGLGDVDDLLSTGNILV